MTAIRRARERPPLRAPFARDEPVSLDHDSFGHGDYVRALASIVGDETAPATIGVFGPWGVGKSMIVQALAGELSGEGYVYFDAWKYEADSLRREFLRECRRQLVAAKHLKEDAVKLDDLDVDTQTVKEGLHVSKPRAIVAGLFGAAVGLAAFLFLSIGIFKEVIRDHGTAERLATAVAAAALAALLTLLTKVVAVTQTDLTHHSLKDPDRFAARFADILRAMSCARVVIVVDNLDRCSPEKAVETLSTIKTYLEPTARSDAASPIRPAVTVDKKITFVVSVDDAALRRHLLAQEAERSGSATSDSNRRYVDEYLAKFFSARLPIRPILPSDIRRYIHEHLDPLVKARELDPQDGRSLVSLVATGLRRNPRQIKQFVNDLESRLRLLQERETAHNGEKAGIAQPVSTEVLMVAKLALLEAEFPDAFERLEQRPRVLDEWEVAAESSQAVWIGDAEPDDPQALQHAQDFATFLQASREIETKHLRALIFLKQAHDEAGLPYYEDFRDAVVNDDQPGVERLLDDATDEERSLYAGCMPQLLRDELAQGYMPGARATVRMVLTVSRLLAARAEVLDVAVAHPKFRDEQLVLLDPKALLHGVSDDVPLPRKLQLLRVVVTRLVADDKSPEERKSAAIALIAFSHLLEAADRRLITDALAGGLQKEFDVYVDLAETDPKLLPQGVARIALETFTVPDDQGRISLNDRDAAFSVATLALPADTDPEIASLAMDRIQQALDGTREDTAAFGATLRRAVDLVELLPDVPGEQWARIAGHVRANWASYPRDCDADLLKLAQLAISGMPDDGRAAVATELAAELVAPDPSHGVGLIRECKELLIDELREAVVQQLTLVGRQHVAERSEAARLIRELAPDNAAPRITEIATDAIQQGHEDTAVELLEQHGSVLTAERPAIVDALLTRALDLANQRQPVPYGALTRLAPRLTSAEQGRLAVTLAQQLQQGLAEASGAVDALEDAGAPDAVHAVVARAAELLIAAPAGEQPAAPLVDLLAARANCLTDSDQAKLCERLGEWLDLPASRAVAVQWISRMTGLRADAAGPLVGKLIEIAEQEPDNALRVQALLAANAIRGAKNTRAAKALNASVKRLQTGSDEDKEVVQTFQAERDA